MKTDKITTRIENGNSLADKVAKYLNFRFKYEFEKASIEEDKKLMIDYKCKKSNKTAQMKCRENKSDIIYEAKRFYSNNASSYEEANGKRIPAKDAGRDSKTIQPKACIRLGRKGSRCGG